MVNNFFGFLEGPFEPAPDPRFFFATEYHQEVIDALVYAIAEKEGLVLLTGEAGLGKTSLIRQLMQVLPAGITAIPVFQPPKSFADLLETILRQLNLSLPENSRSYLLSAFNNYLDEKSSQNQTLAILVDEAQELSAEVMEEFRLLCNSDPRHPRLLKEVLFGEPQIEDKLNTQELRQVNQRITTRLRLRPLSEEESLSYLAHRLSIAGKKVFEIFTPEAASLICWNAQGIPRLLNAFSFMALSAGYAFNQGRIDSPLVQRVLPLFKGRQSRSRHWSGISLGSSEARLEKFPLITKISLLLLAYSLLAWLIFFFLSVK